MQDIMHLWQKNFNDYMEQSTALMTSAMGMSEEEDKHANIEPEGAEQDNLSDENLFTAYTNFWLAPLNAFSDLGKKEDKQHRQKAEENSASPFTPFFWDPTSWPLYQANKASEKNTYRKTKEEHNPFASFMQLAQSSPFAAFQSNTAKQDLFNPFKNQNITGKQAQTQWPGQEHVMSLMMANPLLQQIAPIWQQALTSYWSEKFFDSFNPFKQKRSNLAQLLDPYDFGSLLEHMISTSMTSSLSQQPFGSFFETWTRKNNRQTNVLTLPFFDDLQNQAQQNLHESWKMLLQFSAAPLAASGAKV